MTSSQLIAVIVLIAAVAVIAYALGRRGSGRGAASSSAPVPSEPWSRPVESQRKETSRPREDRKPPPPPAQTRTPRTAQPPAHAPEPPRRVPHSDSGLADGGTGIRNWGYQLQNLNVARAASSPYDLLVIDYAKDGSDDTALKPGELDRLKRKSDGSRRIVLAYLSIGEAESYRSYWQSGWKKNKPGWLLGENPEWEENYSVCFWEPEWQQIMCGPRESRTDRIIDAGFDGVYLDKVDVYEDLREHFKKVAATRPNIEGDMVKFVTEISAHSKSRNPEFLVVMQNAEGLLERTELRRVIDGVAKEELVFGVDKPEKRNSAEDFDWSREMLDKMKDEGKIVLVVEYLNTAEKIREATELVRDRLGYVLYVADKNRELDNLNYKTQEA